MEERKKGKKTRKPCKGKGAPVALGLGVDVMRRENVKAAQGERAQGGVQVAAVQGTAHGDKPAAVHDLGDDQLDGVPVDDGHFQGRGHARDGGHGSGCAGTHARIRKNKQTNV